MAVPTPTTTKPVQMREASRSVYVFRMACFRGYAAIKRLSYLTDNDELIDRTFPQWPENFAPRLR
jgi:hypothetical protein